MFRSIIYDIPRAAQRSNELEIDVKKKNIRLFRQFHTSNSILFQF